MMLASQYLGALKPAAFKQTDTTDEHVVSHLVVTPDIFHPFFFAASYSENLSGDFWSYPILLFLHAATIRLARS